ncbi:class E sortase [Salinibacterium sp. NG253]|uniref:class E sortase n=1 Tax=Salinibacterium sp. NG253 TaxID=2792039 RepID=UPI0018CFEC05|nr:class E sortase [Salinibacterium sp. NG253]MBH0116930.1 class E sortase [Salinibacterium sp. NG253]
MVLEDGRRVRRSAKPRRPISFIGVLGEIFITAGVIVLLFLVWQTWVNSYFVSNAQRDDALELSQEWSKGEAVTLAPDERADPGVPVVDEAPGQAVAFGTLIVPRFGEDYAVPIAESVSLYSVLNAQGVGHYTGTQMPGEVGNFAVAAHRTGYGDPFFDINKLQLGDSIYVETEAGWYRYVYRSLEYVLASGVGVLEPVPQFGGAAASDRIMTLTSCNPIHTADERIIAYAVYDTWYPRSEGAPSEISAIALNLEGAG